MENVIPSTIISPINTIGVAISFSPYCDAILGEAKHLADILKATLVLIHVGDKTKEKEKHLNSLMNNFNIDFNSSPVIWKKGNEVKAILEVCESDKIDLLVLGARIKENILKFYIGSVARKICRKAKCSVMLITSPSPQPRNYDKVVINGAEDSKAENTISTALYLAEHLNSKQVFIANEIEDNISLMTEVNNKHEKQKTELKNIQNHIKSIVKKYENSGIEIKIKSLNGKAGYAISKFSQIKKADLLVISAPETQLNVMDRIFTHDIEYILANLPCNLLIVHAKA